MIASRRDAQRTASGRNAPHVWQQWNTLQALRASLYLLWAVDALLLLAVMLAVHVHRDAIKTLGRDTVPSIIHAQHIKAALAGMDASAAGELLGDATAKDHYHRRRQEAATALIDAARNITYGPAEQRPLEALQVGLGKYEALMQRVRDLKEDDDPGFLQAYRETVSLMDNKILPQADNLDRAKESGLDSTYRRHAGLSVAAVLFYLLMSTALLSLLVIVQKFLTHRMNRILNPMLLLATMLTGGFVLYTFNALSTERYSLFVAREQAFASIRALWHARALAYAGNSDETRYLLDPGHSGEYEDQFSRKVLQLAGQRGEISAENVRDAARRGRTSLLSEELNNVKFPGERDVAMAAVDAFGSYVNLDGQMRNLERDGKHKEAVALCVGSSPGELDGAFERFDQALGQTLQLNQDAFNGAVEQGFAVLDYFEIKASVIALAIALLVYLGLRKRIQEYS